AHPRRLELGFAAKVGVRGATRLQARVDPLRETFGEPGARTPAHFDADSERARASAFISTSTQRTELGLGEESARLRTVGLVARAGRPTQLRRHQGRIFGLEGLAQRGRQPRAGQ